MVTMIVTERQLAQERRLLRELCDAFDASVEEAHDDGPHMDAGTEED